MAAIASVRARQVIDALGLPTLEVDLTLSDGARGRASVPSGGSKGTREATVLRDRTEDGQLGVGVRQAVAVVNGTIASAVRALDPADQIDLDTRLIALDGTETKSRLGANAILGVSMAAARAAAASARRPLFRHLGGPDATTLPVPMFDVLNGGAHADNGLDIEEFMLAPIGAPSFAEAVRWGCECFASLRSVLRARGYGTTFGDLGGYAPVLPSNEEGFVLLVAAIEKAGFVPGRDVVLAVDAAATLLYDGTAYRFSRTQPEVLSSEELVALWSRWVRDYPIWCVEDAVAEGDFDGWRALTASLGKRVTLAGDDVFVSDPDTISAGITDEIGNAVLVKIDQIGTVTEAIESVEEARAGRYKAIVAGRSGETVDDFVADFAVATRAGAIKCGAPNRGERVAKYNQLLRIEEALGPEASYAGPKGLRAGGDSPKR